MVRFIMSGMGTATLVPVETYLSTPYHPDCDYVDGVLDDEPAPAPFEYTNPFSSQRLRRSLIERLSLENSLPGIGA
jgi:hypothetical protein